MRRSILAASVSVAGLMLATSGTALADDTGWYLRANAGVGLHTDTELDGDITSDVGNGLDGLESELDIAGTLGIGYELSDNWRIELDADRLYSDLGSISGVPNTYGKLRTESLMINAIYDFAGLGAFEPYVGAGAGIVRGTGSFGVTDFNNDGVLAANPACPGDRAFLVSAASNTRALECTISNDSDDSFGWQVLAGIGIQITDNLTWDTHATYQDHNEFDFRGQRTATAIDLTPPDNVGAVATATGGLETTLEDAGMYSVVTGLRFRFGDSTPPPPPPLPPAPVLVECADGSMVTDRALCPPPPPPPVVQETFTCPGSGQTVTDLALCPPRVECPDGTVVYGSAEFCPRRSVETVQELCSQQNRQEIIYYEFDRGQSAETRNTINRILDVGAFCQVDNIRVVGHTDTSGSAAYNLQLSKRRAQDAVNELVRQGIDRRVISSEGKGETEPFIQTGDGVKEQLNRRTEVLITLSNTGVRDMSMGN